MAAGAAATFDNAGAAFGNPPDQHLAERLGLNIDSAKKTLENFARCEGLSVEEAHKKLSRKHHPDRHHDGLFDYTAIMQNLNAARDALAGRDSGSGSRAGHTRAGTANDSDDSGDDSDTADDAPRLPGGEPLSAQLRRGRQRTADALREEGLLQHLHLLNVWPMIRPHLVLLKEETAVMGFACPVVPCKHISKSPHDRRAHVHKSHTRLEMELAGRLSAATEEVVASTAKLGYDSPKKAASRIRLLQLPVDAGTLILVGMAAGLTRSPEVDTADAELNPLRADVQSLGSELDKELQRVARAEAALPSAARVERVGLYAWSASSATKVAAILQCPQITLLPTVALVHGEPVSCDANSKITEISHPHLGLYAPVRTTAEEGGQYAVRASQSLLNAALAALRVGAAGMVTGPSKGSHHPLESSYAVRCIAVAAATCKRLKAPANEQADTFADFAYRWITAAVEGSAPKVSQVGNDPVATMERVAALAALALELGSCRPDQWRRVLQTLLRAAAGAAVPAADATAPQPRVDIAAPALVLRAFATLSKPPGVSDVEMSLLLPSDFELRSDEDGPPACLAASLCLAALQCHGVLDVQATSAALERLLRALLGKAKAPLGLAGVECTATAPSTAASAIRVVAGTCAAFNGDGSGTAAKASRLANAARSAWKHDRDAHAALTLLLTSKVFVEDAYAGLSEDEMAMVLPWLAATPTGDGLEEMWRLLTVDFVIAGMSALDIKSDQKRRSVLWRSLADGFGIAGDDGLKELAKDNAPGRDTRSTPQALADELLGAWGKRDARHLCERLTDTALGVADNAALSGVSLFLARARQGDFSSRPAVQQALVLAAEATLNLLMAGGATGPAEGAAARGAAQLDEAVMLLPLQPMIQLGAVLTGEIGLHGSLTAALRSEKLEEMATGRWSGTAAQAPVQHCRPPVHLLPRGFRRAERDGLQRPVSTKTADLYFDLGQATEEGTLTVSCLFLGTHCLMTTAEAAVKQGAADCPAEAAAAAATAWQALLLCGNLMELVEAHVPTVDLLALRHYFALLHRSEAVFDKLGRGTLRLCEGNGDVPSSPRKSSKIPPSAASARRQALMALAWAALRRLKRQQAVFPAMMPQAVSRVACGADGQQASSEGTSPPLGRHSPLEALTLRLYAWTQIGREALELQQAQLLAQRGVTDMGCGRSTGTASLHPPLFLSALPLYRGALVGWILAQNETQRQARRHSQRMLALDAVLQQRGLSGADVAARCDSPAVPRDGDGFLLPLSADAKVPAGLRLPVEAASFSCAGGVDAIVISPLRVRGWSCKLVGRSARAGHDRAVLCPDDVADVLGLHGAPQAVFTLDPELAQASHPLHDMHFLPRTLEGGVLLDAMAQCDWLLKMLTSGVEAAARPPFALRDANDNLLARLPKGLRDKLGALHARDSQPGARRFWVEQGEATVDMDHCADGSTVFKVAMAVPFSVRTRAMVVNDTGEMQDANDTDDDKSVGAEIAALLTAEFEALCTALPIFARLRELSRLLSLGSILRIASEKVKDPVSMLPSSLEDNLRAAHYPRAIRRDVEQSLADVNNIAGKHELPVQQWDQWDQMVENSLHELREMDDNAARALGALFAKLLWMSPVDAEHVARACLTSQSLNPIRHAGRERGKLLQMWLLNSLGMDTRVDLASLYDKPLRDPQRKSSSAVMPAVFNHRNGRLIVGGVLLGGIRQGATGNGGAARAHFKSHSGEWQRVRAEFKRVTMDDQKQATHVRAWLRQELRNRGSMYRARNPPGYDVDHTRNDVNYCRLQYASDNRGRGGKGGNFEKIRTRSGPPRQ